MYVFNPPKKNEMGFRTMVRCILVSVVYTNYFSILWEILFILKITLQ